MPVAVARKIEHRLALEGLDLDIQVRPVALTAEQVAEFNLPRVPIKETEQRAGRFEERHGEGAVELDALEALHPGLLRRILISEIERYHDGSLPSRANEMADETEAELNEITASVHDEHRAEIEALGASYAEMIARHAAEVGEWSRGAETIYESITERLEEEAPDLDEIEWPEPGEGNEELRSALR